MLTRHCEDNIKVSAIKFVCLMLCLASKSELQFFGGLKTKTKTKKNLIFDAQNLIDSLLFFGPRKIVVLVIMST